MSSPLVVIAESQPDLRHELRLSLEQNGFRALPAETAGDLWSVIGSMPVGALVLDVALRGRHGRDLCQEVRERSDVPILLVGANSSEVDRIVGLELGADDYMNKPYSGREVAARLRALLRRSRAERMPGGQELSQARFDGWTVNPARRELLDPDGAAVRLTAAEFSLLLVFVDHPRMVISRARLMELVGMRSPLPSDRSVDVLVSRLRRKLTHGERTAPIVTVRGGGYMFSAGISRDR
ncbi:response regulator transcription factor [Sphingobium bisphenolivorans]|uniref:response regulator transcription factor n=1 Tax=Sphingobium bisphenolivorans TaxID=1335760 RepID=UPI0003AAC954|nr:response regulator transcription factor [Sphingobium bisphenolivorans]